jgi:hypothetical protein
LVWPVSGSVSTRNVGSSSESLARPLESLSWSAFEAGSMAGVGQRVAGRGVLEADDGTQLAGFDALDLLAVVRVHPQQAADALTLALGGVVDVRAGLQGA